MKIKFIANIKGIYLGYVFAPGQDITIGREFGNTIAPINVDGFSRHHARLFFKDGAWFVEDCGSTNGTYRNKAKLEAPAKIEKGDEIRCGTMALTSFEFDVGSAIESVPEVADLPPVTAAEPPQAEELPQAPESVKLEPVELTPVAPAAIKPVAIKRPVLPGAGGLKPGLKLPAKPAIGGLKPGLKLPPKPGIGGLKPGLKLPSKPLAK